MGALTSARDRLTKARARAVDLHVDPALIDDLDQALHELRGDSLLTTSEAAELLGIRSVNTVKAMIHANRIPAQQVGTHYRIRLSDVERLQKDATIQGLRAAGHIHAETESLGAPEGLTDAQLRDLAESRPGTLPWKRSPEVGSA